VIGSFETCSGARAGGSKHLSKAFHLIMIFSMGSRLVNSVFLIVLVFFFRIANIFGARSEVIAYLENRDFGVCLSNSTKLVSPSKSSSFWLNSQSEFPSILKLVEQSKSLPRLLKFWSKSIKISSFHF
jgi:hypothetical protein